jgi:hypothetical protein
MKAALKSFIWRSCGDTTQMAGQFDTSASDAKFTSSATLLNNAIDAAASGGHTNSRTTGWRTRVGCSNRAAAGIIVFFGQERTAGGHGSASARSGVSSPAMPGCGGNAADSDPHRRRGDRTTSRLEQYDRGVRQQSRPPAPVDANVDLITSSFVAGQPGIAAERPVRRTITVHR